ncbi:MAG TPA: DUF3341 domain-containing protein [Chloroflexota bacterium]|nr:DUF3341 domain-containing protein [Chloroflexota bacterium]
MTTSAGPTLGARTVVGVFDDRAALSKAYGALIEAGIVSDDISVVSQGEAAAPPVGAGDTKAGTGTAVGAAAGAVLGGIAGLAALAIPGFGPLIAAGPIVAALSGATTGGAMGALAGSFAGLGVPSEHAEKYEAAVREGGTFISVKTADEAASKRASAVLESHGAQSVSAYQPAL